MDQESRDLLVNWLNAMPDLPKHAYKHCPICRKIIDECANRNISFEDMKWFLFYRTYTDREMWKGRAVSAEKKLSAKKNQRTE